jgi:hypothetical protein
MCLQHRGGDGCQAMRVEHVVVYAHLGTFQHKCMCKYVNMYSAIHMPAAL